MNRPQSGVDRRFANTDFAEVFGRLEKTHPLRRGCLDDAFVLGSLLFLFGFGLITYIASSDVIAIPICVVVPLFIFLGALWTVVASRGDELRIYENGFTYRCGRKLRICLWRDIRSFRRREPNHLELGILPDDAVPLLSVEKSDGETIAFDPEQTGTHEIFERLNDNKAKPADVRQAKSSI